MKKILVPVDYSDSSKKAFEIALQIAAISKASLEILHVFHPHLDPSFPYTGTPTKSFFKQKELDLAEFVNTHLKNLGTDRQLDISSRVISGIPIEAIVERTKADFDLVVLGTNSKHNLLNKVFGTVSIAVAKGAHCHALLVPQAVAFTGFSKILYASNHDPGDHLMLQRAFEFAELFKSEVHFVHVDKTAGGKYLAKQQSSSPVYTENDFFAQLIVADIKDTNMLSGLNSYVETNKIDLIIMATRHRGFFADLFHHSKTRQMAFATKIALAVMHFEDT